MFATKINMPKMLISLVIFAILMSMAVCSHIQFEDRAAAPVYPQITPAIMDQLLKIIDSNLFTINVTTGALPVPLRKYLRGIFHDCMFGCDGSINISKTENRGLQGLVARLTKVYALGPAAGSTVSISAYLSRADFWILTFQRALAKAIANGGPTNALPYSNTVAPFIYGRIDNPKGPQLDDNESTFPDGIANWTLPSTDKNHPTTVKEAIDRGLNITEADMVTLLGLHGAGRATQNNSGFSGPWGPKQDIDVVNNHFYINLLGVNSTQANLVQASSLNPPPAGAPPNPISQGPYYSTPPTQGKIQWVPGPNSKTNAKLMLNVDMAIYYNFTATASGNVANVSQSKYCPQANNTTLQDCNAKNKSYMKLSRFAPQAWKYAKNNTAYLSDLYFAYLRLANVTSEFTNATKLRSFYPISQCPVPKAKRLCLGDIFLTNCGYPVGALCP